MQDFRKLRVWNDGLDLAVVTYEATKAFPAAERYGLSSQMRSAAVSVSSNIAEGCGRPGRRDMARFLGIAVGSACELESQILLAQRLGLLDVPLAEDLLERVEQVKRRLINLHSRVSAARGVFRDELRPM